MRIITEPSIRLVGRQTIDEDALSSFLADEGADSWTTDANEEASKIVEVAGRLCYKSYAKPRPGGNKSYIDHILEVGHGSVIEHAVYNFIITGVSRSFTHELVRHRAGFAYSQRSQRFCDEKSAAFVVPPLVREAMEYSGDDPEIADYARDVSLIWKMAITQSESRYANLSLKCYQFAKAIGKAGDGTALTKIGREAARSVLPNATETQIFVTVNARAARHFIEARGDKNADAEIRRAAIAMLRILKIESPNIFGDYRIEELPGIGEVVLTDYRKV